MENQKNNKEPKKSTAKLPKVIENQNNQQPKQNV